MAKWEQEDHEPGCLISDTLILEQRAGLALKDTQLRFLNKQNGSMDCTALLKQSHKKLLQARLDTGREQ